MIDKEKVLPRLTNQDIKELVDPEHSYRIQLARLGMEHLERVARTQRDADWERVEPLIEILELLLEPNSYRGEAQSIPIKIQAVADLIHHMVQAEP